MLLTLANNINTIYSVYNIKLGLYIRKIYSMYKKSLWNTFCIVIIDILVKNKLMKIPSSRKLSC